MPSERLSKNQESSPERKVLLDKDSDTLPVLATLRDEPLLRPQLDAIVSLLGDPNCPRVLKAELRLQLKASQEKIDILLDNKDITSVGKLLSNMMTLINQKAVQHKDVMKVKEDEKRDTKIESANKRIKAMFDAFGWEDKFHETFPEHRQWEEQAQQKALKKDPSLKDKPAELDAQVKLQVFLDNRQEIEKKAPQGTDLSKIYRELEHSANDLGVAYSVPSIKSVPPLPPANEEKAKVSFSPDEQKYLVRQGDELRSVSPDGTVKVMDMKTGQVYVEAPNGTRVPSKQEYHNSYEIDANVQTLTEELNEIDADFSKLRGRLNAIVENLNLWLPKLETLKADSFRGIKDLLEQRKKKAEPNTPDYQDAEKTLAEVTKMEEEFKEKQKRKESIERQLPLYKQAKEVHARQYQESLQTETEGIKGNLQFMSSTHLDTIFGNEGVEDFLRLVNERTLGAGISLDTEWGYPEKHIIAQHIEKMLWADIFEDDGMEVNMKHAIPETQDPINADYIRGLLEGSEIYGGNPPAVRREKLREAILWEEEDKSPDESTK